MNTSNFNTHRFADVLLWETMLNKRKLVNWALIFFGLIAIPQIIGLVFSRDANTTEATGAIASLSLLAYLIAGAANIFSNIKTKQERINEFTLPASNLEKFVARYLINVIGMSLAAIIGFLAGDLLQYLLTAIIGQGQQSWAAASTIGMNNFSGDININGHSDATIYATTFILGCLAQHAFFLLTGSIFHKRPVIMAVLSWLGISILVILLLGGVSMAMMTLASNGYVIYIYNLWLNILLDIIAIAFVVFCFWFAYYKYTRLQVINNRWFNK